MRTIITINEHGEVVPPIVITSDRVFAGVHTSP